MAYAFTTLDYPGETQLTQALGINNAGIIDGFHGMTTNIGFVLAPPSTYTAFSEPGATLTQLVGINNSNNQVGFYTDASGTTHGFLRTSSGTVTTQDEPNTNFNQLLAVNDTGQEAGYSSLDKTGQTMQLAYVRNVNGAYTLLDNAAHTGIIPMNVNSQATGIDNAGDVVGFYMPTDTTSDGFIIQGGKLTTLSFPGSTFTQALGINNMGQVSGFYQDAQGSAHGFVWSNGLWITADDPSGTSTTLNGINDSGTATGFYTDAGGVVHGLKVNLPYALMLDTTNHESWHQAMTVYSGPLNYLQDEIVYVTTDNINMTATTPNVFLHSGSGEDALQALSGQNVLDGGTGSNFLTNGSGVDTDFVDTRGATADIWSTLNNFHSGDSATVWGVTQADLTQPWMNGQGATGYTGLTTHIPITGGHTASLTLAGFTTSDMGTKLQISFGTDTASNSPYMLVHAM